MQPKAPLEYSGKYLSGQVPIRADEGEPDVGAQSAKQKARPRGRAFRF